MICENFQYLYWLKCRTMSDYRATDFQPFNCKVYATFIIISVIIIWPFEIQLIYTESQGKKKENLESSLAKTEYIHKKCAVCTRTTVYMNNFIDFEFKFYLSNIKQFILKSFFIVSKIWRINQLGALKQQLNNRADVSNISLMGQTSGL